MATLERKKYLKKKIEHLSDRNLMEKIDSTFESNPYILSDEQKKTRYGCASSISKWRMCL